MRSTTWSTYAVRGYTHQQELVMRLMPDVKLSSGRTITRTRMPNGAWDARPTEGPAALSESEWEEYVGIIRSDARQWVIAEAEAE